MANDLIAQARTLLFVPGNRPERFAKAARSGADAVVLDLEDSVPRGDKAAARASVRDQLPALSQLGVPVVLRINAADSAEFEPDLALLRDCAGLASVMLPKADSADVAQRVHEAAGGLPLLPLIETAAGLEAVRSVAGAAGVLRLVVGAIDFMADTGISCDEQESELAPLRFAVAMATRTAGLASAIDGVTVQTGDEARLRDDTRRALRFGFGGKLCIHPSQIASVHAAMRPTEEELSWATRVLEADRQSGGAAVQLDGHMVDLPVVLQARRTVARARRPSGEAGHSSA